MTGREHMLIGTTSTVTIAIGLIALDAVNNFTDISLLIFGGIIGSYMPDIDSKKSKAGQIINKLITISIVFLIVAFLLGLSKEIEVFIHIIREELENNLNIVFFLVLIILGKISPHRMFTHKWLGTMLFCLSVHFFNNIYLTLGFSIGYILHILCDRFSANGNKLNFFEFKLPCRNSRNKFTISW